MHIDIAFLRIHALDIVTTPISCTNRLYYICINRMEPLIQSTNIFADGLVDRLSSCRQYIYIVSLGSFRVCLSLLAISRLWLHNPKLKQAPRISIPDYDNIAPRLYNSIAICVLPAFKNCNLHSADKTNKPLHVVFLVHFIMYMVLCCFQIFFSLDLVVFIMANQM